MKRKVLSLVLALIIMGVFCISSYAVTYGPYGQGYGSQGQQVNETRYFHANGNDVKIVIAGQNMLVTWCDLYKLQGSWVKCGNTYSCVSAGEFLSKGVGPGDYKLEIHYIYPSYPSGTPSYLYYYIVL